MMNSQTVVESLSGSDLLSATRELVRKSRGVEAELLLLLGEIDERRLYLERPFPSMFAFCVGELGFSEDAAYNRINLARAARRMPIIADAPSPTRTAEDAPRPAPWNSITATDSRGHVSTGRTGSGCSAVRTTSMAQSRCTAARSWNEPAHRAIGFQLLPRFPPGERNGLFSARSDAAHGFSASNRRAGRAAPVFR